jgi:hypothetical protein
MADISLNPPKSEAPTTAPQLRTAQQLLLVLLFIGGCCWAAVNEAASKDRCETPVGKLAVKFKMDSYFSNCRCMKHSLDFSDACNSMYLPLVLK